MKNNKANININEDIANDDLKIDTSSCVEDSILDVEPSSRQTFEEKENDNVETQGVINEETVNTSKKKSRKGIIITKKLTLTAILSGMAFGLYMLGPLCKLPFIFPSFLDLQFSELPALIGGFALGPFYGALIVIIKCALKLPMTSTAFVGELSDCILGLTFVLTATILYRFNKTKKGALISLAVGTAVCIACSLLLNRFLLVPAYLKLFFKGNWAPLVGALQTLFPKITQENFYNYYLWCSVLPFNLLRCLVTSAITFLVYKSISRLFKKFTA